MIYIKLSERLKNASPTDKRNIINSDETWAFTEHPKDMANTRHSRIEAHDLFHLFTASIIREKTDFTR